MRRRAAHWALRFFVLPIVIGASVACGGNGSSSPTSPTPLATSAPQLQGTWTGLWNRQSCSGAGGAAGACSSWPTSGSLSLNLTQSGTAVEGTVTIGAFPVQARGSISNGTLTLNGQGRAAGATVSITSWNTSTAGSTVMTGNFTYTVLTDDARDGALTVGAALQGVVKQ